MPNMFASREPDAEKLAGQPTSPAEKYTPSSIASKNPTGTATVSSGGLPYGNTPSSTYTATAPSGGLAAQANGYQTGPYLTNNGTSGTNQTTATPSNSLASSPTSLGGSPTFASPYGGTYTGVGGTNLPNLTPPASQLPVTSVANSLSLPSSAPLGQPTFSPPTETVSNPLNSGSVPNFSMPQNSMASGVNSLPSMPSTNALPAYPSLNPPLPTATATAVPGSVGVAPAVSAYQSAPAPSGAYAPGTTGRTTNYNFGTSSTNGPSSTIQSRTLPPNTASGQQLLVR